jgi:hypothetical protein
MQQKLIRHRAVQLKKIFTAELAESAEAIIIIINFFSACSAISAVKQSSE